MTQPSSEDDYAGDVEELDFIEPLDDTDTGPQDEVTA